MNKSKIILLPDLSFIKKIKELSDSKKIHDYTSFDDILIINKRLNKIIEKYFPDKIYYPNFFNENYNNLIKMIEKDYIILIK